MSRPVFVTVFVVSFVCALAPCRTEDASAEEPVDHPVMTQPPAGLKGFDYEPAQVPFYDPLATQWGALAKPLSQMQKPLDPEE
jgi:hypothetical protein